jgi:predicted permease
LALGIGVSCGIVSSGSTILFRPLASPEGHRLVKMALRFEGPHPRHVAGRLDAFSYPEFQTYRASTRALDGIAATRMVWLSVRRGEVSEKVPAEAVSENYFDVLALRPRLGRLFSPSDANFPVVVLGYHSWQRDYRGDTGVIGRTIEINRERASIIGVAPEGFDGTDGVAKSFWIPLSSEALDPEAAGRMRQANLGWIELIGRRAAGYSLREAQAEALVIASHLNGYPDRRAIVSLVKATRVPAAVFTNPRNRGKLDLALASGIAMIGLVLFLCASNLAGLLLARGMARQRELAVRLSIGAGRARLVRQLLSESLLLATLAGIAGIIACHISLRYISEAVGNPEIFRVDAVTLLATIGITFAATLLFGLAPALAVTRVDTFPALKGGGGDNRSGSRLRSLLIGAQVATSLVLLIVSALHARGFQRALEVDHGFEPRGLYAMDPDFVEQRYTPADIAIFHARLRERLRTMGSGGSLFGGFRQGGVFPTPGAPLVPVQFRHADASYFPTLGVTAKAGRLIEPNDPDTTCVINQAFVDKFWPGGGDPVGRVFGAKIEYDKIVNMLVAGVIPTLKTTQVGEPDAPTFYFKPRSWVPGQILIRGADRQSIRQTVRDLDPKLTPNLYAITELMDAALSPARNAAWAAALLATLGLAVSAIGIYGAVAFSVVRRTREIGVRVALGAESRDVVRTVLGRSLRPVMAGVGAGLAVAVGVARFVPSATFDPLAFGGSAVVVAVAALLAGWAPARRALRIPPTQALRHE